MNHPIAPPQAHVPLALGAFALDLAAGELLTREGRPAGLRKQALQVLLVLGSRAGAVVTRSELMSLVWPGVVVGDGSLTQAIADIRRVLDDHDHRIVRNVARRGYMLVPEAPGETPSTTASATAPTPSAPPSGPGPLRRPSLGLALTLVLGVALTALLGIGLWHGTAREHAASALDPPALSIVVLPPTPDEGDEAGWFADALHHDLTLELGRITGTVVISRETAARFRDADPRDVARELKVRFVVQGTVRRQAERVKLALAMTDGRSGAQHWAEVFELARSDWPAHLQTTVLRIARSLSVQMHRSSGDAAAALQPDQARADDLAMQGFSLIFRGLTPANLRLAGERFDAALRTDPDSVRAWGGVQTVAGTGGALGWVPREQAIERLRQAADRLGSLDQHGFYTHSARIFLAYLQADWDAQLLASRTAAERFPSHPASYIWIALAEAALGRFDSCITAARQVVRIGPYDNNAGIAHFVIATCHFMREEYRDAVEQARLAQQANPALPSPPVLLAASLVRLGRLDEARAVAAAYREKHPDYRAEQIGRFLRGRDEAYLRGRDRVIESLREAGFP